MDMNDRMAYGVRDHPIRRILYHFSSFFFLFFFPSFLSFLLSFSFSVLTNRPTASVGAASRSVVEHEGNCG